MKEEKDQWETLKIQRDMSDEIDSFLATEEAKKQGFHSKREFVSHALRTILKDFQTKPYIHLNTYEDKVRVQDNIRKRIAEIYFKKIGGFCELCESTKCNHIEWIWNQTDLSKLLKDHGLKSPF